jgi:ribosomal protein S27AE
MTDKKVCPKCNSEMIEGFILPTSSPINIITLGAGIYWSPHESGDIGTRKSIKTYACSKCGYLESYFRYKEEEELEYVAGERKKKKFTGYIDGQRVS